MSPTLALAAALLGPARPYDGPSGVAADPGLDGPELARVETSTPPVSRESPPAATEPSRHDHHRRGRAHRAWPKNWAVGGFVDTGYAFENNLPDNHVDRGNFTSPRINEFSIQLAVAYVRHTPTDDEPWLLELAGQVGPAAAALLVTEPRPGGDASQFTGPEVWQHLGRGNVGVRIPKVGTEFAVGLFTTPIGYFSFWSKDNWTYSTPWHLNAVPYVLMGGRITQPIGKKLDVQLWIDNGWQTYGDVNRLPSAMPGINYRPVDGLLLSSWVHFGAEDVDNRPRAWRVLSDTYVIYDVGRWALSAVFDLGRERLTAIVGEPVAWWMGGAVSARGRIWTSRRDRVRWDMVGRGEVFWDRDGRMFGVPQLLGSGVYGNTLTMFDHVLLRVEYRYDRSTSPTGYFYRGDAIHDDDDGLARDQHAVYFALTGYFEHAFATRRR